MKILIAEDDTTSRLLFSATLRKLGHTVTAVDDGRKAWEAWRQNDYSLLISDWIMPHVDGLQLCRMVRAEPTLQYTYIILLTAMDSKGSYLEGMDAGADDFITKPLGIDELFARVRAALRRAPFAQPTQTTKVLEVGVFRADLESRHVTVEGREIHLTPKEFDLLTYFMTNAGKVLTHRTLLKAVWGGNYVDQNEYLRVFVGQLRKKVEPEGTKPRHILTEPWVGYRFEPTNDPRA